MSPEDERPRTDPPDHQPDEPAPQPALPEVVPPVVAVVVTHDPGPWFDETLESLAQQTYGDLGYLFIDTASTEDPTEAIHAVLPDAHVHRLDNDPGYSAAANLVGELVEGASFHLFCHDDVALDPDAVRALVEEAFRSNAGIVGPKLVDWNDPRRILQVGLGADKTGVLAPLAEPGELDQEQHDAVRDVFVVSGACSLVRADLFEALDGFDAGIERLGEDLDLCWRAHVVGARVIIAPAARVRHLEAMGSRQPVDDRRRLFARHRLRTSMVAYGPWHRLRVLPQAAIFAIIEALYGVLSGHPDQARDVLGAWPWNWRRLRQIRTRRKALAAHRLVSDSEVRGFQVRGSARFNALVRGQLGRRDDRVTTFARSSRDVLGAMRAGSRRVTGAFAIALGLLLIIGSRNLVTGGIPAVGELARFSDGPNHLFATWWSGWRTAGLGGPGYQPTAYGLLGVAGYLFFGAMGVLRNVLVLSLIPLGALGAWRMARPIGSSRASVAAFAVYLAIPVPYNALARGSLSGLVAYAVSPWLMAGLGRATGIAPFGPGRVDDTDPEVTATRRSPVALILGLGILLALAAAITPAYLVVAVAVGVALALGSLFCFRVAGVVRLLTVTFGAAVVAFVLHLPWSLDLVRAPSPWTAIDGVGPTSGGLLDLGHVLRFESGPWGAPPLGWAFLLAGVLPVIIGRSWRLEWAVRSWFVVVGGWALVWAGQAGHLPFGLPAVEVVLAPVATALALAAALGLASFEIDLRAYRFGWRQVLSVAAAIGVALGALPLGAGLLDGRWRMPSRDYAATLDPVVAPTGDSAFRVLWIGDPDLLPAAGWRLDDDVAYATTDNGMPTITDRFSGPQPGRTTLIRRAMSIAEQGRTNRLGHLLAPMGIRYLVLPSRLAPPAATSRGTVHQLPASLVSTLGQQLDLEEIPVSDGLLVYQNTAAAPMRSLLPTPAAGDRGDRTQPDQAVFDDLSGARPILTHNVGTAGARGSIPEAGEVMVAQSNDPGWSLRIDGVPAGRVERYGWALGFDAGRGGPAKLSYHTPLTHHLAVLGQALAWILALWAWRRARRHERGGRRRFTDGAGAK